MDAVYELLLVEEDSFKNTCVECGAALNTANAFPVIIMKNLVDYLNCTGLHSIRLSPNILHFIL